MPPRTIALLLLVAPLLWRPTPAAAHYSDAPHFADGPQLLGIHWTVDTAQSAAAALAVLREPGLLAQALAGAGLGNATPGNFTVLLYSLALNSTTAVYTELVPAAADDGLRGGGWGIGAVALSLVAVLAAVGLAAWCAYGPYWAGYTALDARAGR